jgi:anthranilate synthase/aminodeoxychorismate synthase-like glutamine amidotransferase
LDILLIDNFDSFTYNLADEFEKRNCKVHVYRNNINLDIFHYVVAKIDPKLIVISPGPSNPQNAGISREVIRRYAGKIPLFGVCLGHQCIIEEFGGIVDNAPEVMHGKPSKVHHDNKNIYQNVENPFNAGRYHSLSGAKIPDELNVTAKTDKGIVMGVRHKQHFVQGVQFHPESILTAAGGRIVQNLLESIK